MIYVLCLNWNGKHLLEKMLPGLKNNLKKLNINSEIHIRDNGSKDGSLELLNEDKHVNLLSTDHNRDSFSEGVNSLINKISPQNNDLLLLLNNDIEFIDNHSLLNMYNLMQKTNAAVCGARLMYDDKKISHTLIVGSKTHGNMPWNYRSGCELEKRDLKDRFSQAVTAACSFIKADNLLRVGMLNTNYKWAFEDVDVNFEISINQKEKIVACGGTNIIHGTSESLKKNPVNKLFLKQNVAYFKNKWDGKYLINKDIYDNDPEYNVIK